jgi:hypothetical protein
MTSATAERRLKTILALSAVEGPDQELARSQAYIERELERADRIRALGFAGLADRLIDRLCDSIISPVEIAESELRALWGDR